MDSKITLSNGSELSVNFMDLDFRKVFYNEVMHFSKAISEIDESKGEMDILNKQYNLTEKFIDKVFGDGEMKRLLKDKRDLALSMELIVSLTKLKQDVDDEFAKMSDSIKMNDEHTD